MPAKKIPEAYDWLSPPMKLMLRAILDDGSVSQNSGDSTPGPITAPNEPGLESSLVQADDLVPAGEVASVAAKLKAALLAKKAGAGLAAAAIELKPGVIFDRYRRVMQGVNPLDLTAKELGQHIQSIGPDVRFKNGRLIGAQMIDQYGTTDPEKLMKARLLAEGVAEHRLPILSVTPNRVNPETIGSYHYGMNKVSVHPNNMTDLLHMPNPEEVMAGVIGHEAQHAKDYLGVYKYTGIPERFLPRPATNDALSRAGFLSEAAQNALYQQARRDPELMQKLPDWLQERIKMYMGNVPGYDLMDPISPQLKALRANIGDIVRQARGNGGFKGNNAILLDRMKTDGHFLSPIRGEMDIPPYYLAKQQAELGGEVGPWEREFPWMIAEARSKYASPMVQVPALEPAPKSFPSAQRPWMGKAAAAAALAGLVSGKSSPKAAEKKTNTGEKPPSEDTFVGPPEGAPRPGEGTGSLEEFYQALKKYNERSR